MFLGLHHRIGLQQEIRREMRETKNQKYFDRLHLCLTVLPIVRVFMQLVWFARFCTNIAICTFLYNYAHVSRKNISMVSAVAASCRKWLRFKFRESVDTLTRSSRAARSTLPLST